MTLENKIKEPVQLTLDFNIKQNCIWYKVYNNLASTTGQGMKMAMLKSSSYSNFRGILKYGCNKCKGSKDKCTAYLPVD